MQVEVAVGRYTFNRFSFDFIRAWIANLQSVDLGGYQVNLFIEKKKKSFDFKSMNKVLSFVTSDAAMEQSR
jgi:hypothetical protein